MAWPVAWRRHFFSSIYTRTLAICLMMLFGGAALRTYFIAQGLQEEVTPLVLAVQQAQAESLASGISRDLSLRREVLRSLAASLPPALLGQPLQLQAWLRLRCASLNPLFTALAVQDEDQHLLASAAANTPPFTTFGAGPAGNTALGQLPDRAAVALSVPLPGGAASARWYVRGIVSLDERGVLAALPHDQTTAAGSYALVFPAAGKYLPLHWPLGALQPLTSASHANGDARVTASVTGADWTVEGAIAREQMQAPVTRIRGFMVRSTVIHLLLLLVLVGGMVTWFVRPLKRAATQAQRMARGELPLEPLNVVSRDEVGELMAAFNLLLQRLEQQSAELTVQMRRAESAAQARTRFLAAASHDMRQPMHALNLYLGALASFELPPAALPVLASAVQCARTMDEMFRALLDISRLDANTMQVQRCRFPVALVLEKIETEFSQQAAEKGLLLRVARCGAIVESDLELVERILRNLVSNAVRYTPHGRILLGCRRNGDSLRVSVYDTGVGIAPQDQEAVFEEFYQVDNPARDRAQGLGLGLALVHRLANLLAAPLTLRSAPGAGSQFSLALPLVSAAVCAAPVAPRHSAAPQGAGSLVAVIDDEVVIRDATTLLLTRAGYRVVSAASGAEILAALAASDSVPAAIICDYRLRHNETGSAVVEALREEFNSEIPALLITGDTSPERIQALQASGLPLLHKPLQNVVLLEALATLLATAQQR